MDDYIATITKAGTLTGAALDNVIKQVNDEKAVAKLALLNTGNFMKELARCIQELQPDDDKPSKVIIHKPNFK